MTTMRLRIATLFALPLLVFATSLHAQPTMIRDLAPVPQDSIDALVAAGQDLSFEQMYSLVGAFVPGAEQVTSVGVVVTDPLSSGLASWRDDEGGPGRLHIYVRDTAAASLGTAGMGIQLVDSDWRTNGSDELIPGDVIEFTGLAGRAFETSMQFEPTTVVPLGNYVDFGIPDAILAPDTVTTSDINMGFADGTHQSNWANYNDLNGAYVCVDNASVFRRTVTGQREDWVITSDGGETILNVYDMSLRYRNDRVNSYQPPFNVRTDDDDPFTPPAIGATVRLCGTLVHQGDDPFFLALPQEAAMSIVPWVDADLTILESPPQVGTPTTPESLVGSGDAFTVVADVTFDPSRTPAGVTLYYVLMDATGAATSDTMSVSMANTEGTSWAGDIPGTGVDRAFVVYWTEAADNTGAVSSSNAAGYRVFDSAVASISEIQESVLGGAGDDYPSPLAGLNLAFDLAVTVQSQPAVSGFVSVQDDADGGPWSGIIVDMPGEGLNAGDEIVIATATIEENYGVTRLTDVVTGQATGKVSEQIPHVELSTADLQTRAGAEMYEGMLVNFSDVTVTENLRYGEWTFTNGTEDETLLGDGESASFPDDNSVFTDGSSWEFLRGIWWYSFGSYKLVPEDANDVGAQTAVAVEPIGDGIPGSFALNQNYPNPFNPTTVISYDIPASGNVELAIFDVTGRLITTLVSEQHNAGTYQVTFDARDLSSGLYLYRLTAGEHVQTNKMLLMR